MSKYNSQIHLQLSKHALNYAKAVTPQFGVVFRSREACCFCRNHHHQDQARQSHRIRCTRKSHRLLYFSFAYLEQAKHPCCNQKVDKALWQRYRQQIKESEGFDIKYEDCPSGCLMVTIWPVKGYLRNPENVKELEDYAQKALDTYNTRQGTKYVVEKILKVNGSGCRGFLFYITLTIATSDGENLYFQAKVV